jgi:drug/metabolite transporter (DMT)-like permease
MHPADLVLVLANVLYGTSYLTSRIALEAVPPATLAFVRLVLAGALLGVLATRRERSAPRPASDRWRIAWMGILGFAVAYALAHWGVYHSTVTNASLLIVVEPLSLIVLSPLVLGERLGRLESVGAGLAIVGTVLVVVNGVPGLTERIAPHWKGDLVLILSGIAFAAYTLIGRDVLARHEPFGVTLWSIVWGAAAIAPLAAFEWTVPRPVTLTPATVATIVFLGLAISGYGYLVWNWAIQRVPAPRAAVFLTIQPIVGAGLGNVFLGEPVTPYTIAGGGLIVLGLALTVRRGPPDGLPAPSAPNDILEACPSPAGISSRTRTETD